jgi:hypothetical protein
MSEPEPRAVPVKVFRVAGTTDDVTTCELCGRDDLKSTVIMVELDADGNDTEPVYYGSDCAARASGWTQNQVRTRAARADRQNRRRKSEQEAARRRAAADAAEEAFLDWLHATYGTRDKEAVMRQRGLRTAVRLYAEYDDRNTPTATTPTATTPTAASTPPVASAPSTDSEFLAFCADLGPVLDSLASRMELWIAGLTQIGLPVQVTAPLSAAAEQIGDAAAAINRTAAAFSDLFEKPREIAARGMTFTGHDA